MSWNVEEESRRYERLAEDRERRAAECRLRVAKNKSYEWFHDEALGEFYVFNHLHGRTFLNSSDDLRSELREMKKHDFRSGSSAFNFERFEEVRQRTIDGEIARLPTE